MNARRALNALAFYIWCVSLFIGIGCAARKPATPANDYAYILKRECLPPEINCGHDEHCTKTKAEMLCPPELRTNIKTPEVKDHARSPQR